MKKLTGDTVTLLGNIPPRDTLSLGSSADIRKWVAEQKKMTDLSRVIWSCGGGMPQDTTTENIRTFINAVNGS
jgi:uroporphyrinogen decarboxylase